SSLAEPSGSKRYSFSSITILVAQPMTGGQTCMTASRSYRRSTIFAEFAFTGSSANAGEQKATPNKRIIVLIPPPREKCRSNIGERAEKSIAQQEIPYPFLARCRTVTHANRREETADDGRARMRWGESLEFVAEAGPGDFIYVPPYVPHQEINASPDTPLMCV